MTVAVETTAVALELDCRSDVCRQFGRPLFEQMASGRYDVCSVLPLGYLDEWRAEHRTARKRADRASRRGYAFGLIDRHLYSDDIHAINTSAPVRQKRPMTAGYLERTDYGPLPAYPCRRHAVRTYGVTAIGGHLVAYLWLYRVGQLALVSQILGHDDHLDQEVMWLLVHGVFASESAIDRDGFLVYNRHDSGTDGLRWFKQHCGFEETEVEWLP